MAIASASYKVLQSYTIAIIAISRPLVFANDRGGKALHEVLHEPYERGLSWSDKSARMVSMGEQSFWGWLI